ncbi:MAG: RNA methyltransferase [Deltaproteobacteria bacterium]|nr:RNA methyltransferase [Deltaproteobacteria bacterium]
MRAPLPDSLRPEDEPIVLKHLQELAMHPLGSLVSERRLRRMIGVLLERLTSVTLVAENFADPHNISALIRTAEGFGLDRVHVVEMPNKYQRCGSIVRGADRWLEIEKHQGLSKSIGALQANGFVLAAADVGPGCVPVTELPVDKPLAIVMGSERDGLSKRAKSVVDIRFTIPMQGFTESFNVSVSAAVTLFEVSQRRRAHLSEQGIRGELDEETRKKRLEVWLRKTVNRSMRILEEAERRGEKTTF